MGKTKNTQQTRFRHTWVISIVVLLATVINVGFDPAPFTGTAHAACPSLDTSKGVVTASVDIPEAGDYRVWSRIMASSATDNSYYLEVDDSTCGTVVGDGAMPTGEWQWVDHKSGTSTDKITLSLTAGTHTIRIVGREAEVKLDRLLFLSDQTCIPTDLGGNCIVSVAPQPELQPDLVITSATWTPASPESGNETTFSATIKNQGEAATPADTIHGVSFSINGETVTWSDSSTSSLAPGESRTITANGGPDGKPTWQAVTGTHTVEAFVDDVNRVSESNEDNNKLSKSVEVSAESTDTPPPASPVTANVPVYRLYLPKNKDHFYTTSEAERDRVVQQLGYKSEGVGFEARSETSEGLVPVYRLYTSRGGNHFYTTSASERDVAVNDQGYKYQGIAFYAKTGGNTPVYRLYSPKFTNHFYTTSEAERDGALKKQGYQYQGIGWYIP